MGRGGGTGLATVSASGPTVAPLPLSGGGGSGLDRDDRWRSFDNTVNAVSFGFIATAVLISMFLIMAIFERFLRSRSSDAASGGGDISGGGEASMRKTGLPFSQDECLSKRSIGANARRKIPTFLAHPAPPP